LVLFVGDLNVNALQQQIEVEVIRKASERHGGLFDPVMPLLAEPYASLLHAFKDKRWRVIDCLRTSEKCGNGVSSPITFADTYLDENQ